VGEGEPISCEQARGCLETASPRLRAEVAQAISRKRVPTYKDVQHVLRAQRDLVRITRRLRPVLSYKAT
jgi:hypothetical protein